MAVVKAEGVRMNKATKKEKTRTHKRAIIIGAALAGVLVLAGLATVVTLQFREISSLKDPSAVAKKADAEADRIKKKAGKIILLPKEEMTLATVQDIKTLKKQSFFKNAANGDKVLIFADAKQAIIYREQENKIINAGPIVLTKDLAEGKSAQK